MLNGKLKRVLGCALAFAMALTLVQAAFGAAPPEGAEVTDIYSAWAAEDVFYAQSVYGLGNEGTYSGYRGDLYTQKFLAMAESLGTVFSSDYEITFQDEKLTRGQVITILYGILEGGAPTEEEAVEYFIENGLLLGRKSGEYQLDEICTVEEMIIFASRLYDHGVYGAGNYSTGFFWTVEGEANTVYLLGSLHISDESMYPMNKSIEAAFARTANLVVEIDINGLSEEENAYIMEIGMIDPESGETIADYISEETYALYVDVCEAIGLPAEVYDYFKPWMASNVLSVMLMVGDMDAVAEQAGMGIDMYFLVRAVMAGKPILQLESAVFQIDLLASASKELQEKILLSLLNSAFDTEDEDEDAVDLTALYTTMNNAVKTGDEKALKELLSIDDATDEDKDIVEFHKKMFYDRDVGMTEKIVGFLTDGDYNGDYFVVVGAAHLVNADSIIDQLTALGYKVDRVLK